MTSSASTPWRRSRATSRADASSASRLDEPVETDVTDDVVTVRRAPATDGSSRSARSWARSSPSILTFAFSGQPADPELELGFDRGPGLRLPAAAVRHDRRRDSARSSHSSSTGRRQACEVGAGRARVDAPRRRRSQPGDPLSAGSAPPRRTRAAPPAAGRGRCRQLAERVPAGEPVAVLCAARTADAVGAALEHDGRHRDRRLGGERPPRWRRSADRRRRAPSGAGTSGSRRRRSRGCRGSVRSPRRPSRLRSTRATTSSTAARRARVDTARAHAARASEWK